MLHVYQYYLSYYLVGIHLLGIWTQYKNNKVIPWLSSASLLFRIEEDYHHFHCLSLRVRKIHLLELQSLNMSKTLIRAKGKEISEVLRRPRTLSGQEETVVF